MVYRWSWTCSLNQLSTEMRTFPSRKCSQTETGPAHALSLETIIIYGLDIAAILVESTTTYWIRYIVSSNFPFEHLSTVRLIYSLFWPRIWTGAPLFCGHRWTYKNNWMDYHRRLGQYEGFRSAFIAATAAPYSYERSYTLCFDLKEGKHLSICNL